MSGHGPQLDPLAGAGFFGEQPGGLRFQRLANDVPIAQILGRRNPNARAHPRTALHQSLLFQALDRLGDRQEAHAEFRAEFAAGERRAERVFASENLIQDTCVCLLGKADWQSEFISHFLRTKSIPHDAGDARTIAMSREIWLFQIWKKHREILEKTLDTVQWLSLVLTCQ